MTDMSYADAPFAVRNDLGDAHAATWERIASPGTWFDGETRVAIAAETRNAAGCRLCAERKDSLSPYAVEGIHDSLGALPENLVEVIHRIVSDPGRLMRKWYEDCLASGLTEEEYVEIVGVTCSTVSVDTFCHAAGLPKRPLPEPKPGEPTRMRPPEATQGAAARVAAFLPLLKSLGDANAARRSRPCHCCIVHLLALAGVSRCSRP